jgi:uncharacterized membrane protein YqjE
MDDAGPRAPGGGLGPAVTRLATGALALARARLELAGVELAQERERLKSLLVLAVAGAVFATLAVAALSIGVLVVFWDTHRYPALAALVLIYGGCAAFAFSRAAAIAREAPTPFSATIAEFEKDRAMLAGEAPPPAP